MTEQAVATEATSFVASLFGILVVCLVGLAIGAVAKLLLPGKDPGGILVTMLLGIAGSLVGGLISGVLGVTSPVVGLIMAVIGAILLLLGWRFLQRGRTSTA